MPGFGTTIPYLTVEPTPGETGVWILSTDSPVVTGCRSTPTAVVLKWSVCAHEIPPVAYAVFETCVATHTTP